VKQGPRETGSCRFAASQRKKAVTWPSASGQTTKCQWFDMTQEDGMRIGCRWCASIMTRWNASKSAFLPKRCILPTDRFNTMVHLPARCFSRCSWHVQETYQKAVIPLNTSCVPVSVPRLRADRSHRSSGRLQAAPWLRPDRSSDRPMDRGKKGASVKRDSYAMSFGIQVP
jgi:hypothetical protein